MILTKNSPPQKKIQIIRPSYAFKVSSKQTNPEVLQPWYSTILNIELYHFFHSQSFSNINLV